MVNKACEVYRGRHGMIGSIGLLLEQNPGKIKAFLQSSPTQIVGTCSATPHKLKFLA